MIIVLSLMVNIPSSSKTVISNESGERNTSNVVKFDCTMVSSAMQ